MTERRLPDARRLRRRGPVPAFALLAALALSACGQSMSTSLPPVQNDPRKFMTKEEQAKAIADMTKEKDARRAEAIKDAEKR